ncbi:MAG: hypothetical protein AB1700_04190 [Bacillota bacterium]|jgi:hypothetical protein
MSTTIRWDGECPIAQILRVQFAAEIAAAQEKHRVGPSLALCSIVCPAILGHTEDLPDGRCSVRARFLKEVSADEVAKEKLRRRFDACVAALNELFAPVIEGRKSDPKGARLLKRLSLTRRTGKTKTRPDPRI